MWYVPVTYVRSNGDAQFNFTHPETTWLKADGQPGKVIFALKNQQSRRTHKKPYTMPKYAGIDNIFVLLLLQMGPYAV